MYRVLPTMPLHCQLKALFSFCMNFLVTFHREESAKHETQTCIMNCPPFSEKGQWTYFIFHYRLWGGGRWRRPHIFLLPFSLSVMLTSSRRFFTKEFSQTYYSHYIAQLYWHALEVSFLKKRYFHLFLQSISTCSNLFMITYLIQEPKTANSLQEIVNYDLWDPQNLTSHHYPCKWHQGIYF